MAIKIFINTKQISLYNYIQYLETDSLKYFCSTQNAFLHLFIPKKKLENAKDLVLNEMLTGNYEVSHKIGLMHKIEKYKVKFFDVQRLTDALIEYGYNLEVVNQLAKWGHKIKQGFDVLDQLYKIKVKNQALITEIEALEIEVKKSNKVQKIEIEEILYNLEQGLEMKYKLNLKELSLFEFLMLQKKLEKKIDKWHK